MPKMLLFQHAISIKNTEMFYLHFLFHAKSSKSSVYFKPEAHLKTDWAHIKDSKATCV